MASSRIFVIVPMLNEAVNLPDLTVSFRTLTEELRKNYDVKIIVVDDGSTDKTADVALQMSAGIDLTVLRHERNMGPGAAFGTAFESLAGHVDEQDWVVTIEGDNTSRRETLRQMLHRTEEGYDVVMASPYMYGGGIANTSAWRTFLSHVSNAFVKEALGIHGILTMTSFYRLYRGRVIVNLQKHYGPRILDRKGFECMIELLLKMIHLQTTISEVPMLLDTSRNHGKSKMKVMRTIRGYLTLWKDKSRWLTTRP